MHETGVCIILALLSCRYRHSLLKRDGDLQLKIETVPTALVFPPSNGEVGRSTHLHLCIRLIKSMASVKALQATRSLLITSSSAFNHPSQYIS